MVLLSVIPALYKVVFEKVFKRLFVSSSERCNELLYSLPTTHEKKDYIGPPQPALVQIPFFFTLSYPAHCPFFNRLKKTPFRCHHLPRSIWLVF